MTRRVRLRSRRDRSPGAGEWPHLGLENLAESQLTNPGRPGTADPGRGQGRRGGQTDPQADPTPVQRHRPLAGQPGPAAGTPAPPRLSPLASQAPEERARRAIATRVAVRRCGFPRPFPAAMMANGRRHPAVMRRARLCTPAGPVADDRTGGQRRLEPDWTGPIPDPPKTRPTSGPERARTAVSPVSAGDSPPKTHPYS